MLGYRGEAMFHNDNRETYIVIGCGHFGHRAVQALKSLSPSPRVVAVDNDRERLRGVEEHVDQTHHGDGIHYLAELPESEAVSYWIVPALPLHLALEGVLYTLNRTGDTYTAEGLPLPQAFNPKGVLWQHRTPTGTLYCSLSDFTCPDDCPEPEENCYITGQPHPAPLYRILEETPCAGYHPLVVRSRILAPGVGGYPFTDLLTMRSKLSSAGGNYLLSTACTCHGVTDAIAIHVIRQKTRVEHGNMMK